MTHVHAGNYSPGQEWLLNHVLYDPHHYAGKAAHDLHTFLEGLSYGDLEITHLGNHGGDLTRPPVALEPPFKRDDLVDVTVRGHFLGTGRVIDVMYSVGRDWLVMATLVPDEDVTVYGSVGHPGSSTHFTLNEDELPDDPIV